MLTKFKKLISEHKLRVVVFILISAGYVLITRSDTWDLTRNYIAPLTRFVMPVDTGLFTELIGLFLTYAVFEVIRESSNKRQQELLESLQREQTKQGLIRRAGSTANDAAKSAVDELRKTDQRDALSGKDLTYADLKNARLEGFNLTETILSHAILSDVEFRNANLSGADLSHTNLECAKFTDAILTGADFSHTILKNVEGLKENKTIHGTTFYQATLEEVDFSSANLKGCNFQQAEMSGKVNFSGADLTSSIFGRTKGKGQVIIKSDTISFKRSKLTLVNFDYIKFEGNDMTETRLNYSSCQYASFDRVDLTGADLTGMVCHNAVFIEITMRDTILPDGQNIEQVLNDILPPPQEDQTDNGIISDEDKQRFYQEVQLIFSRAGANLVSFKYAFFNNQPMLLSIQLTSSQQQPPASLPAPKTIVNTVDDEDSD